MAAAVTSCAPCVFGALETSLLSLPYDIVGTINVIELPQTFTVNGSVSTSTLTSTLDVASTSFIIGPPGASQSVVPVTLNGANPTWSTLGTVLTYPTTYVQYLAFQGAAVTSPATACAQTLSPTSLTLPASTEAASYIFPQDNSTNAIPIGLLDFLDTDGTIPAQLDGDQLTTCATLGGALAASTTPPNITISTVSPVTTTTSEIVTTSTIVSTSFSTSTSISTSTSTISTFTETSTTEALSSTTVEPSTEPSSSVLEVTLTSSILIPATTESTTVIATQTLTKTPAYVINTITGPALVAPTPLVSAAPAAAESMSTEPTSTNSSPSELISNLFSILESLTATTSAATLAPYINSTTNAPGGPITSSVSPSDARSSNASTTSHTVPFDGAATHNSGRSIFGGVFGLLATLLML